MDKSREEELTGLLLKAREEIQKLQHFIDNAVSPPYGFAVIAEVEKCKTPDGSNATRILANLGGSFLESVIGDSVIPAPPVIEPGMLLKVNLGTKVPAAVLQNNLPGQLQVVKRRIDSRTIELASGQAGSAMQVSRTALCKHKVEPGDMVLLDPSGSVVISALGPDPNNAKKNVVPDFRPVEWSDIGGLDEVKGFFHDIFERPLLNPAVYRAYNLPPPKGALMFGPPGCGKTLIGRAFATDLARRYGTPDGGGFMSVKGPEMLSMWVGQTEQNIRELFDNARKFKQQHGYPAVIFFDEAEAIMNKRGSGRSSDMDRTIVPAFLAEMDGLQDSGAIILLATNRPEMLDPAIIREGRIDRKVHVPRPNASAICRIMELNLANYPTAESASVLANRATEFLFRDDHALYVIRLTDGSTRTFGLSNITSGALAAAIVQQAASTALNRDLQQQHVSGINIADMKQSILSSLSQHRRLDYKQDVDDFVADYRNDVVSLDRVLS